jgi:hypothetical protein
MWSHPQNTAKALSADVPPSLAATAHEVIERSGHDRIESKTAYL